MCKNIRKDPKKKTFPLGSDESYNRRHDCDMLEIYNSMELMYVFSYMTRTGGDSTAPGPAATEPRIQPICVRA